MYHTNEIVIKDYKMKRKKKINRKKEENKRKKKDEY